MKGCNGPALWCILVKKAEQVSLTLRSFSVELFGELVLLLLLLLLSV
jgi:hypothetical protein